MLDTIIKISHITPFEIKIFSLLVIYGVIMLGIGNLSQRKERKEENDNC